MYYRSSPQSKARRPRISDDDEYYGPEDQIIFPLYVEDAEDVDTGIVDEEGNSIMRRDRVPLGFLAEHDE